MKKIILPFLASFIFLAACSQDAPVELDPEINSDSELPVSAEPHEIQDTKAVISGNYLGSDYKGNYVWGGAMNLAWTDLREAIIKEDISLATHSSIVLEMVKKLNNPSFAKTDLDSYSYYIKSGYGQETVEAINKESKAKFPDKSFADLNMDLGPTDIIAYAYFLKAVEYVTPFFETEVDFNGEEVEGFYAEDDEQKENVTILSYESDDKFIVGLKLKDETDQLILAKGYDMKDAAGMVEALNNIQQEPARMDLKDRFKAPFLSLDLNRDYVELIDKSLVNAGFEEYMIAQMYENIKFDMDEKGARVENEAVIVATKMADAPSLDATKPKNLYLDKPYWVIMKRADSENPYFILGVNNTELMEKVDAA